MKKEKITIYTISDFFLSKRALTPKKLQKLVYYAYAWFIALNNQSAEEIESVLFEEAPEAWVHGPVFPSLYAKYKELADKEEGVIFGGRLAEYRYYDMDKVIDQALKVTKMYL